MNELSTILNAWQQVRSSFAFSPQQERADEFFADVASRSDISWEELGREAREDYGDVAPEILSALLATDNPLIVLNSLRFARLEDAREAEVFQKFIRNADPQKHEVTLATLADMPEMKAELKARRNLPKSVLAALKKK